MATKMIASMIKISGDRQVAGALAAAAIVPDVAEVLKENKLLRVRTDDLEHKYNNLRHKYYSEKIKQLQESMAKSRKKKPWWHEALIFIGAAVYFGVTGFVRLLIVKEE